MNPSYNTLSAAIRARAWVRLFRTKRGREPTVEERVTWIARMNTKEIDVAYVNRSCENMTPSAVGILLLLACVLLNPFTGGNNAH